MSCQFIAGVNITGPVLPWMQSEGRHLDIRWKMLEAIRRKSSPDYNDRIGPLKHIDNGHRKGVEYGF